MKIAVMPHANKIEIREVPIPEIAENEVLVKVQAVGICTWEQKYYNGINGSDSDFPFLGGHEICGTVEKVGLKVAQKLEIGDKVVVASMTRCGECNNCRRGYDNQCENSSSESRISGYVGPAGFSQYFAAKGYEIYKVPNDTDPAIGALAEPLACVNHSIDMGKLEIGDYALILGGGIMGLLHVLLAKQRGATVIISEPDEQRRKKALESGASYAINPLEENLNETIMNITSGRGVEAVFFTAGGKRALEDGITSLAKRGTLVVYGSTSSKDIISFDPKIFHYREIHITGVISHTKNSFRKAAEIISNKSLPLGDLVSGRYTFENIEQGFEDAKKMTTYRMIIQP
jgi:2-desacetyl-2-hydroxyethyl bacteriochlorophyllide A dehydrogenase